MANPFRRMRGINDRVLNHALTNHQANIEGIIVWAAAHQKRANNITYWLYGLSVAVIGLLVHVLGLIRYIL